MSDFHSLGKVLQGMWREGAKKKAKNRRPVHQHNTHQKALLATYGIDVASDDMTHPSIQNTSVTRAMQQQGDVKAAVSIGVCALH